MVAARYEEGVLSTDVPMLNFLFMADNDVPLSWQWRQFFAFADTKKWSAYVHCQDFDECYRHHKEGRISWLRLVPTVGSKYCDDLVSPMVQLVKYALQHSPKHDRNKFIFVSDSTLPFKPFSVVYDTLVSTEKSDICLKRQPWKHLLTAKHRGREFFLLPATQWSILNLEHANLLHARWPLSDAPVESSSWRVPLHCSSRPEACPKLLASNFSCTGSGGYLSTICNGCGPTDSVAVFASIFGAMPMSTAKENPYNFSFSDDSGWSNTCRTYASFMSEPGSDVYMPEHQDLEHLVWFDGIHVHGHSKDVDNGSHPWTFDRMNVIGVAWLRSSDYLFARKFTSKSNIQSYLEVALAEPEDFRKTMVNRGLVAEPVNCASSQAQGWGSTFQCVNDGRCVPKAARCNGMPDCGDQSDEVHCDTAHDSDEASAEVKVTGALASDAAEANVSRPAKAFDGHIVHKIFDTTHTGAAVRRLRGIGSFHINASLLRSFGQPLEVV